MRSILSRFTLYSVAALALSGLIAGCSGGTSSSLPGGTSANNATGGSLSAQMMLAKLQEQIKTHNFPKVNVGAIKVHHMTMAEVTVAAKALGVVRGGQARVHQGSNSVDIIGGFGFSTTTSPPGPYSGIFGQLAAYCVGPPAQLGCSATVGPPFFSEQLPPGPPPAAYSTSSDVEEALVAPGGGCYIPIIEYQTVETYTGGVFEQFPTNWFDFLNLCSFTGNAFPLDQGFFSSNYINASPGAGEPPTLNVESFNGGGPDQTITPWSLGIFNTITHAFDDFTVFDSGSPFGFQTNFLGGGFAGYLERSLAIGPCQALPNATGGLGIQNVQIYDSSAGIFRPLAPTMPGGTFAGFNQPVTTSQTCFHNDGTHIGQQYQINGAGSQPFFTGGGGQMLITSFPSP